MSPLLRNYFLLLGLLIVIAIIVRPSVYQKEIDWKSTYLPDDKIPFGTYILNQEIDNFFDTPVKRSNTTPYEFLSKQTDSLKKYNFIWINRYIDHVSVQKILHSVHNGSYALLVNPEQNVLDSLHIDYQHIPTIPDPIIDSVSFKLTTQNIQNQIFKTNRIENLHQFTNFNLQQSKVLGYSYLNGVKYINFIEVSHGKGKLFIHLNPIVFTNYFLKKEGFDRYTASVLAYLPPENETIWFSYFLSNELSEYKSKNPLSIIFKYPALSMGWRIFIIGFLLYIIFQGKRKQRIIPILNKEKNTTIEFAQTIANLYFQQGSTSDMVKKKILYFLDNIRNQFYIDTQKINDDFLHKLQQKSNQPELSQQIVSLIQTFEKNKVANQDFLIQLDQYITDFWKKVRK